MPNQDFRSQVNSVLTEMSLYKPVVFTQDNLSFWRKLLNNNVDVLANVYCVECKQDTTFAISNPSMGSIGSPTPSGATAVRYSSSQKTKPLGSFLDGFHVLKFNCMNSVSEKHLISFMFLVKDSQVIKVGQYPSLASLEFPKYKKYRKLLGDDYQNLTKAIGLYANGIGVGSFVYLRRIFENLIFETFNKNYPNTSDEKKKEFKYLKMNEKISKLEDYLPDEIVQNPLIYSVLSIGIHELSEDECKEYFPVIKIGIEIILDYKLEEIEKERKRKVLQDSLSQIKNNHK